MAADPLKQLTNKKTSRKHKLWQVNKKNCARKELNSNQKTSKTNIGISKQRNKY